MTNTPKADLYRMVMPQHTCPYGLKAKDLLQRQEYEVQDHWLTTREEVDAFKKERDVATTPQTFIKEKRIGGYDDLRRFFGKEIHAPKKTSYRPIIVLFKLIALMAFATRYAFNSSMFSWQALDLFISL